MSQTRLVLRLPRPLLQVVTLIATERDRDRLDRDQCAVMTAVAELPELSHLAVGVYACGPHIGCLAAARQLTRVVLDQGGGSCSRWQTQHLVSHTAQQKGLAWQSRQRYRVYVL